MLECRRAVIGHCETDIQYLTTSIPRNSWLGIGSGAQVVQCERHLRPSSTWASLEQPSALWDG